MFAVIRSKNKKNFRKLLGLNVTCESFSGGTRVNELWVWCEFYVYFYFFASDGFDDDDVGLVSEGGEFDVVGSGSEFLDEGDSVDVGRV